MRITGLSGLGVGIGVWTNTGRTLTSLFPPLVMTTSINQTLAASAAVNFQPSAGTSYLVSLGAKAGAAGTLSYYMNDGTNIYLLGNVIAGSNGAFMMAIATNTCYVELVNNDATNAAKYGVNLLSLA
jgi:hypothetical protein